MSILSDAHDERRRLNRALVAGAVAEEDAHALSLALARRCSKRTLKAMTGDVDLRWPWQKERAPRTIDLWRP